MVAAHQDSSKGIMVWVVFEVADSDEAGVVSKRELDQCKPSSPGKAAKLTSALKDENDEKGAEWSRLSAAINV